MKRIQYLGTSPESLVKVNNGIVTTNPIAGTKPRGKTPEEDEQTAKDLLNDEKEIAEHRMLVDLGRNDIGRISEIGSVQIEKYMKIEYYKYVMHIVSEVTGQLNERCSCFRCVNGLLTCWNRFRSTENPCNANY